MEMTGTTVLTVSLLRLYFQLELLQAFDMFFAKKSWDPKGKVCGNVFETTVR